MGHVAFIFDKNTNPKFRHLTQCSHLKDKKKENYDIKEKFEVIGKNNFKDKDN